MIERADLYDEGVRLFNEGRYWHAHEAWEDIWLDSSGPARLVLQSLIQMAAALYHVERDNPGGATRLFTAAEEKLRRVPEPGLKLDRDEILERLKTGSENPNQMAPPRLELLESAAEAAPAGWCTKE